MERVLGLRRVVSAALWAMTVLAFAGTVQADPRADREVRRPAFPELDTGAPESGGLDAVNRLGARLPAIAAWYGRSAEALRREFLNDAHLRVDSTGRLLFVDSFDAPRRAQSLPDPPDIVIDGTLGALDQTFLLHSRPGANRTIYLDFNGATVTNTGWNSGGNTLTATPFDIDGKPATFSDLELQRIQYIWQRVAEDYAPFDVDVTTEPPSPDRLTRTDANDQAFGTTVVITKNTGIYSCTCGGIAYIGVFNAYGGSRPPDYYKPAFVFYEMLGAGDEKSVAEAAAHEAGHNMGLHHDGTAASAYYEGQGNDPLTGWAPIMGSGYSRPLVQFSKGEYAGANNTEDDFAVAQQFGLPLRADDYGSDIRSAASFAQAVADGGASGSMDGVIETANDTDVFAIGSGAGALSASVVTANRSADLDVVLSLRDADGKVLISANPVNALNAALRFTLPAQGTYYLQVQGTGQGDPRVTGYSNYGSVGNFRLTASFPAPAGTPPTAVISPSLTAGPAPLSVTFDGRSSRDDGRVASWYWDFGDGSSDVTGTQSAPLHVYQAAGTYLARLTVFDDTGLRGISTQSISVTAAGPASRVQAIAMVTKADARKSVWAVAAVTVVDQLGKPLRGAKISASWSGPVNKAATATTGADGKATLTSPKTKASGCFNLLINSVTLKGYPLSDASQRSAQSCP